MDDAAGGVEGHDAVGHVQKQRRELVALVFRLGDRVLQNLRHVVEVLGQVADLVAAVDRDAVREVPRRDALCPDGQRADGRNEDLRQQKRQDHTDHQTQRQRAQDDNQQLARQRVDRGSVIADVGDILRPVRFDRHGQIHIVVRDRAVLPDRAVHGGENVRCHDDRGSLV